MDILISAAMGFLLGAGVVLLWLGPKFRMALRAIEETTATLRGAVEGFREEPQELHLGRTSRGDRFGVGVPDE